MAAPATLHPEGTLSIEEYWNTRYQPNCDSSDGRLEHRRPLEGFYTEQEMKELFAGEYEPDKLQKLILLWLAGFESKWQVEGVPQQRLHVSATRARVCDFCVLGADVPWAQVIMTPLLLCLAMMSPTDRMSRASRMLEDYRGLGVPHLGLINPSPRKAWGDSAEGLAEVPADRLQISGSPIFLPLAERLAKVF